MGIGAGVSPTLPVGRESVCLCPSGRWVNCGKTTDWIWMPFGVVSGIGHGMRVLIEVRGNFGVKLGRPIVTSGDFVA